MVFDFGCLRAEKTRNEISFPAIALTSKIAREICSRLRERGHIAYFAGGWVRDLVRGLTPKDFHVPTDAVPEVVQKIFPRTYAVGAKFGVVVVVENGMNFEVATFFSTRG
jgi:tRNA nucleotidyltransferase/poly(A) polymerase